MSSSASAVENETENGEVHKDFIMLASLCAIAASENSPDTLRFVKINITEDIAENNTNDYGNTIVPGHKFSQAKYFKKLRKKKTAKSLKKQERLLTFIKLALFIHLLTSKKRRTSK